LIEQPIDGTWFAGAGSPAAMARIASRSSRRSSKKSTIFLPTRPGCGIVFQKGAKGLGSSLSWVAARQPIRESEPGRREEMAPQAFEITQNGTGNGVPRLCCPSANSAMASAIIGASATHRP
jgi:hypothetical protein